MTSMLIDLDQASQMVFESAQKMAAHIPLFSGSKRQRYEMHEVAANAIMRTLMKVFNHDCPLDERTRNNIISHHIDSSKDNWMHDYVWANFMAELDYSDEKSKEVLREKAFQKLSAEHTIIYHQVQARSAAAGQKLLDWARNSEFKATKIFDFYTETTNQAWINGMDKSLADDNFQLVNFVGREHIEVINTAAAELGQALLWNKQGMAHSFIHTMATQWAKDVVQWSTTSLDVMSAAATEVVMDNHAEIEEFRHTVPTISVAPMKGQP